MPNNLNKSPPHRNRPPQRRLAETLCRDADRRKARGESPRYIDPPRWQNPPDHIPHNWPEMSFEALMAHFNRARRLQGAPQSTVVALMLDLRERGTKALSEPVVRRRLSELSEQQLRDVGAHLQRLKPEIAWSAAEIPNLISVWTELQNGRR